MPDVYTGLVARGWESKAVEAQQEEARRREPRKAPPSSEELARRDEVRAVQLARSRIAADLTRASVSAHREMLMKAIEALDGRLEALGER